MPERPPSSALGATTWRLTDSPDLLASERVVTLRRSLLLANIAGFLGGYFVLHNQWLQLTWSLVLGAIWLAVGGHADLATALRRDRWMQAMMGLGALMLVRSSIFESPGATLTTLWLGWGNSFLLLGFLLMLWQVGRQPKVITALGKPLVAMAAVAAGVSLVGFYSFHPEGYFGARLQNCFVYGGLNPVCTGLTFGFAACWAAAVWSASTNPRERWLWLLAGVTLYAATLMTLCRGALLALVCAHVVLLLTVRWKRSRKPVLLMVGCLMAFQLTAPILAALAAKEASERFGTPQTNAGDIYGHNVVAANQVHSMVTRADSGRMEIYLAALGSMTTWQDWLIGKGLWADDDFWSCSLHWYPEHIHGVFWDTFVHAGLPSLLALVGLVFWGLRRAYWLAQQGEPIWITLSCYGLAGLLFDGDTIWALVSVTRYETLLFWTPLVIASARFTQFSRRNVA